MEWPGEWWRRLLFLFRRRQFDRDLEEEMRFHLEMKAADAGPQAARRAFGNTTLWREDCRAAWGLGAIERIAADLRYAARGLRKSPGFTAVAVLTLALGIGANTAIFSFVDRLLLRPLPFPESDRLASLYFRDGQYTYNSVSYPEYAHYRDRSRVFSQLAAYDSLNASFRFGDDVELLPGEIVSANYFPVLGVSPALGRNFRPEEDAVPGRNPVIILGYGLWQRRFGGDPGILGRTVNVNDVSLTVIGIAPRNFAGLDLGRTERPEFWIPTMMFPAVMSVGPSAAERDLRYWWGTEWLGTVGRLRPGATFAQADADVNGMMAGLRRTEWPAAGFETHKQSVVVIPSNHARLAPDSRKQVTAFLEMLMAVVGLVLLIACANVAGLLMERAAGRRREIGVRLALGAGRGRLFQQLLAESLLLVSLGGAAGLAVAVISSRFLASIERPLHVELLLETGLDGRILLFALGLSVLTGIVFGLVPVRQAAQLDLIGALKVDPGNPGRKRLGARKLLVCAQVALSVVLLAGAGLFVRTLRNARAADVTRDPGKVMLVELRLPRRQYFNDARSNRFYADLLSRVHAIPGVRSAATVFVVPMGGRRGGTNIVPVPGSKPVQMDFNVVSEEYFAAVGLPIVQGRGFESRDRAGAPEVAVVNEQMARRYWPGENPVGKQIGVQAQGHERPAEIVGVVRDGKFRNYRALVFPCVYVTWAQHQWTTPQGVEIRTTGAMPPLAAAVRREIRAIDKDLVTYDIGTLESFRDAGLGQERLSASLLSALGLLAVLVAAVGLFGVLAFSVARRTREIGIRMALGARSGRVVREVLAEAASLVAGGLGIGFVFAFALARATAGLLYGVTPSDPGTYAAAAAALFAVTLAASWIPARRASRVDPVSALRHE